MVTQGDVILASLESLALGFVVKRFQRKRRVGSRFRKISNVIH